MRTAPPVHTTSRLPGSATVGRPRVRPIHLLVPAACLALAACGGDDGAGAEGAVRRDSAGVEIVRLPAASPGEDARFGVGERPRVSIGSVDGPPEQQLTRVPEAVLLGDGRILVVNSGSQELRAYGPDGEHLATWASEGEGPGEFQNLMWAGRTAGDSVVAWDASAGSLSVFGPGGGFSRETRVSVGGMFPRAVGLFGDGTLLVRKGWDTGAMFAGGTGTRRDTGTYVRVRRDGGVVDTLGSYPGDENFVLASESRMRMQGVPFGRKAFLAVGDSLYHRAGSHAWEVRSYRPDGTLARVVRRPSASRPVTEEMREAYRRSRLGNAPDDEAREALRSVFEATPWGEEAPALAGLEVGSDGTIWVRAWRPPGAEGEVWTALGPDGTLRGRLRLPGRVRAVAFASDRVAVVRHDDLDVEHLEVHRLVAPGGA